jgi:hypothetical protein
MSRVSMPEMPGAKTVWIVENPDGPGYQSQIMTDEPPKGMGWSGRNVVVRKYELVETFMSICDRNPVR